MKAVLSTLGLALISFFSGSILGQENPTQVPSCLFIPNNISVRCDDYNKDFTLEIGSNSECSIQKMEVFSRWGNTLFSTEVPPWEWYGGKESTGAYNVVVTYLEKSGEIKTKTQAVYLIK